MRHLHRCCSDGAVLKSCGRPLSTVAGRSITTIEGLGTPQQPHPLQQAFLDEQAGQLRLLSVRDIDDRESPA